VTAAPDHYYAGGESRPLAAAAFVLYDTDRAAATDVDPDLLARVAADGTEVRPGLVLVAEGELPPAATAALDAAAALQPVYRDASGSLVGVLPEVRIEVGDATQEAGVRAAIEHLPGVEVVSDDPGRMVLRPTSGKGADALGIANGIWEAASPAMAQARMLRIVDHPGAGPT
jgi:hypothetical protein